MATTVKKNELLKKAEILLVHVFYNIIILMQHIKRSSSVRSMFKACFSGFQQNITSC